MNYLMMKHKIIHPIINISSFQYPDRSFPSIDDDFNFDFYRFDNDSIDQQNLITICNFF